jgi:hypothetical protein
MGLPERKPGRQCVLQVGSGRTIPIVKETLVELTLGQWAEGDGFLRAIKTVA